VKHDKTEGNGKYKPAPNRRVAKPEGDKNGLPKLILGVSLMAKIK